VIKSGLFLVFVLTMLAGSALALMNGFVNPDQAGFLHSIELVTMVVLGGLGSVAGAYFGGMIVGLVEAFAGFYIDPELKQAIWFLIFLAVLIVRPTGLFGQVGAEEVGFREQG